MKFEVFTQDVRSSIYKKPGFVESPELTKGTRMFNLLTQMDGRFSRELSAWLNQINNQGITEINCRDWYYRRNNSEKLPLYLLSTGEVMFAATFASQALQQEVYLRYGVRQLTERSMRTLITGNKENHYLTILCDDYIEAQLYEGILEDLLC